MTIGKLKSNAIKGDSIKGENFRKIQNEMIIFPYITIIERAINRENLKKLQNKFYPFNGVRQYSRSYNENGKINPNLARRRVFWDFFVII